MSEDRRNFNFDEARQSEARVRVYAVEVERAFKNLKSRVDESNTWWTGPSRDAFVVCANDFLGLQDNVVNVITVMADDMRKTMEDKERHEEETVGFINGHTYTPDIYRSKTKTATVLNTELVTFSKPALPMSVSELWEMFAAADKAGGNNAGADETGDAETSAEEIVLDSIASLGAFLGLQINSFMQTFNQWAEMLRQWNEGREERYQKAVEKALANMIKDDGSYYRGGISRILSQDSDEISEAEYYALAMVFVTMDTTCDMEYYLRKLAHKTADKVAFMGNPSRYTTWEFDPEKVNAIIEHIEAMADSAVLLGLSLSEMSDGEVSKLYRKIFPGQQHRFEANEMRNKLWNEFADRRRALVEKIMLLSVVRDLSASPGANESVFGKFHETGEITGIEGDFGPYLSLILEDGQYLLTYTTKRNTILASADRMQYSPTRTETMHKNKVTISKTMSGVRVISAISGNATNYFIGKYSFDFTTEIINASVAFINNKIIAKALKDIPVLGYIVSLVKEADKIMSKKAESERIIKDMGNSMKAFEDGQYVGYMQFDAVVVGDGTSQQLIMLYPGPETFEILQRLNYFLRIRQARIIRYGLTYPITMEDAISNADAVRELIESLSENEWTAIRSPRDFQ